MHYRPAWTIFVIAWVFALALPKRGPAQVGKGCLLGVRGGLAAPVGVLAEMESAGWTGATDFVCPVSGRVEAGAQIEVTGLDDLVFASVLGTLSVPLVRGGTSSGLFVRPQLLAGATYQAYTGIIIIPGRPREDLADDVVFTAGTGLDAGFDPEGFLPVVVGGRWRLHFNESEDFQFGDFPVVPGYGELHRLTVTAGVLFNL